MLELERLGVRVVSGRVGRDGGGGGGGGGMGGGGVAGGGGGDDDSDGGSSDGGGGRGNVGKNSNMMGGVSFMLKFGIVWLISLVQK